MADSISSPDKEKGHAHHYLRESHGLRDDIDEDTSIDHVKGPNVFERAKEEFEAIGEAIIEAIHHKKESQNDQHSSPSSYVVNWDTFKPQSNSGKPGAHSGESHGLRNDIDEESSINDVRAPNVFERAKEEFEAIGEAIGEAIHPKKESENNHRSSSAETFKAEQNSGKSDAHSESHGLRDDLDEETPIDAVKAPNVFERAKEEIEAIGEAIGEALHIKKEPENNHDSSPSHFENWGSIKTELNSGKPVAHSDDDIDTHIEEVKGPSVFARAKGEFEALLGAIHPRKESNDSVATPKKNEGFTVSFGKGLEKICSPKNHKHDD